MQYYGTVLSENISRREPEGYLLCLNVPVARTGWQEYLPEELWLPPAPGAQRPPGPVSVFRPEEEVFSPETMASFEGMPVTNGHPPDGVDIRNIRYLQAGHAHNVRRGSGRESDLLLADLIITDPRLIEAVLAGKREISCGYNYELCEENGRYVQRKIRGNHIAVVEAGRAGPRVSIKDAQAKEARPIGNTEESFFVSAINTSERRKKNMKKSLTRLLARMAKDGDAETVAEFIEALAGETEEKTEEPAAGLPEDAGSESPAGEAAGEVPAVIEVPENREITVDEDRFSALLDRLDRLLELLAAGMAPAAGTEDGIPAGEVAEIVEEVLEGAQAAEAEAAGNGETAEAAAAEIAEMVESILEPAASTILEENRNDCGGPDPAAAKDALRAALRTFRPALQRMTPRERLSACEDIAAGLRAGRRSNDAGIYAALASGRKAAPSLGDLGKRIMASRNPNYHN